MIRFLLPAVLLLAGCAVTSDVMEMADGTFVVYGRSHPPFPSIAGAAARRESQKFCAARGQRALVVEAGGMNLAAVADLQFICDGTAPLAQVSEQR